MHDEHEWLGHICQTGEQCPIAGYWKQVETDDIHWHETDDKFPELELTPYSYKGAHYEYIGKKKVTV